MATIIKRHGKKGVSYRVQIRRAGQPPLSETFDRASDARKWASSTEAAINEGRFTWQREDEKHTLEEAIARYKRVILSQKAPNTQEMQGIFLDWWQEHLGHKRLADLTSDVLIESREKLQEGRLNSTVNSYTRALSHVFSIAVREWHWMKDSPLRDIAKLKEPRSRVRFLSAVERDTLLASCRQSRNTSLYTIVVLALSTGMRKMELLNLQWQDVDFTKGELVLYETKNREIRTIPLTGYAKELVQKLPRRLDTHLLFPSRTNPHVPMDLEHSWALALKRAKIEDFHFHDLRHSCASYLAMNGATLVELSTVLGHKTLAMVRRYAHLSEAHTSSVVARMNQAIFGQ